MFRRVSCLTVQCDVCEFVAEIDDVTTHFTDAREAVSALSAEGWDFETSDRALCDRCAATKKCALVGHRWGRWGQCCCRGDLPRHRAMHLTADAVAAGTCACETRRCGRCTATETRPPATTGGTQ